MTSVRRWLDSVTMRVVPPLLIVWLAPLAALPGQRELREFQRAFRPVEDPSAAFTGRVAALVALGPADSASVVDALVDAWNRAHTELRAVERARERPAQQLMPSVSEMRERESMNQALELMAQLESALTSTAGDVRSHALRRAFEPKLPLSLRSTLAGLAAPKGVVATGDVRTALRDATRPDDAWIALRVLECMKASAGASAEDVIACLDHDQAVVRVQAARALGAMRARAAVRPLIAALDRENGRPLRAVADALELITGLPLGSASANWQTWWDIEGEDFVSGKSPRKNSAKPPAARAGATRGAYFGIPQDGRSVLYLVDFSKSMNARPGGKTGPTRWDECVRELVEAIGQLGDDRTFNIVVFAQRVVAWNDGLVRADRRNVAAAETWIRSLDLELGTAVFEGFEVAYRFGGPSLDDRYFEPAVDTIFFLSDGLPTIRTAGASNRLGADDPMYTLALARRRDPLGSIVVNAVMLGRSGGGPFMKQLAAEHRGVFVAR